LIQARFPVGIAVLFLAAIRLINRLFNPPPALPDSIPPWHRL